MRRALEVDPQGGFQLLWLTSIMLVTGRASLVPPMLEPLKTQFDNPFYTAAYYTLNVWVRGLAGDFAEMRKFLDAAEGKNIGPPNLQAVRAWAASQEGRSSDARALLPPTDAAEDMMPGNLMLASAVALRSGQPEMAAAYNKKDLMERFFQMLVHLSPELHPLYQAVAPHPLVWPLEAPMLAPEVFARFSEVRIASGRHEASELPAR